MPTSPRLVDHMMSKMEEERKDLQNENESLLQKLRKSNTDITDYERSQTELRAKLVNFEEQVRSYEEQIESLKDENGRLLNMGGVAKTHIENEEKEKTVLLKQFENLESENRTLRVTVEEAKNEIKRWQEETNRYKSIANQYEDSCQDNGDLEKRFEEQTRAMKKLAKENAQNKEILREEIEELKKEKSGKYFNCQFRILSDMEN